VPNPPGDRKRRREKAALVAKRNTADTDRQELFGALNEFRWRSPEPWTSLTGVLRTQPGARRPRRSSDRTPRAGDAVTRAGPPAPERRPRRSLSRTAAQCRRPRPGRSAAAPVPATTAGAIGRCPSAGDHGRSDRPLPQCRRSSRRPRAGDSAPDDRAPVPATAATSWRVAAGARRPWRAPGWERTRGAQSPLPGRAGRRWQRENSWQEPPR
jgi:hypothetical protein